MELNCIRINKLIINMLPSYFRLDDQWSMTGLFQYLILFFLQVEQSKVLIKEGGVQLLLTIVDTPGFGDAVDNSDW